MAPSVSMLYPKTSPCQDNDCAHGFCFLPPDSSDYMCKCQSGWTGKILKNEFEYFLFYKSWIITGKRCEILSSISIGSNGTWAELEPLRTKPDANVTIVLSTTEPNGVLIYNGDQQHIAVELYLGRIRISYDVGNYPPSTMYRYQEQNHACL